LILAFQAVHILNERSDCCHYLYCFRLELKVFVDKIEAEECPWTMLSNNTQHYLKVFAVHFNLLSY